MWMIKAVLPYLGAVILIGFSASYVHYTSWPLVPEKNIQMQPSIQQDETVTVDMSRRTLKTVDYGDVIQYRMQLGKPALFINMIIVIRLPGLEVV